MSSPTQALLMVTGNRVGINTSVPITVLDLRNRSNSYLVNVKTGGQVGLGISNPKASLDVSGNVKLRNSSIIYASSTSGQTNADFRLVATDNCNTYTNGSTTGWYNSSGAAYNTVTTFNSRKILGGYGATSGTYVYKDYTLPTHTFVRIVVEYYQIDSWDYELAYVKASDGTSTGTTMLEWHSYLQVGVGPTPSYGGHDGSYYDYVCAPVLQGRHTSNTLRLIVGSSLDSASTDESFGVGSVEIWVR